MSSDTIEPALLARVHDDFFSYEQSTVTVEPSVSIAGQLPPLREVVGHDVSARRNDPPNHNDQSTTGSLFSTQGIAVIVTASNMSSDTQQTHVNGNINRALGDSSPQSIRKILGNDTDNTVGGSSNKRSNPEAPKEDFVQLPQPRKKQKTAKQIVPPIIIGLHDIPTSKLPTAYLPRIESGAFRDSNGRNSLNTAPAPTVAPNPQSNPEVGIVVESIEWNEAPPKQAKKKRNTNGIRRRWEDDETEWLIQGTHKHGVGNWTDILNDPEYPFHNRSASALKDRFRTVCPSGLLEDLERQTSSPGQERSASKSKSPRSRAHRKHVDDLAKLGIETAFKKSDRRERKPFTEDEDREILRAVTVYGNQWARMTRDQRFDLQSRTSTDLRDRYRNMMKCKERGSPAHSSSETLTKSQSNIALSSGHPSSLTFAQEPPALQSSTLNSGEPRSVEGRPNGHPSSSDLYSQNHNWVKESLQDFRSKDGLPNGQLPSIDPFLQTQESMSKTNEPRMKDSYQHSGSSRSKIFQSNGYQQLPDLDLRAMALNRPDEAWLKEHQAPTTNQQTTGLRIQEMISQTPEQEDSRSANMFSFPGNFNAYPDHQLDSTISLPYSQPASFDWNQSSIAAPFTQNLSHAMAGDMDISRFIEPDGQWSNDMTTPHVQGMDGKEKQSFTNISSILSNNNDEPHSQNFLAMLNADGPPGLYDY